jgi:hypothetical protein
MNATAQQIHEYEIAKELFELMMYNKSIALNVKGKEFWKSHCKKVWKIQNLSSDEVTLCDPNTHQIFEGVSFDNLSIVINER